MQSAVEPIDEQEDNSVESAVQGLEPSTVQADGAAFLSLKQTVSSADF